MLNKHSRAKTRVEPLDCKQLRRMPTCARVRLLIFALCASALVACGGGGGGPSTATLSSSATSFSVSASVIGQAPAPIAIVLTVANDGAPTTYNIGASYSTNGIESVSGLQTASTSVTAYIRLKPPSELAPGTHADRVTFGLCQAQGCQALISGSEVTVSVGYTVTAVVGSHVPTAALAANAVSTQTLLTDTQATPISVALSLSNFGNVTPAVLVKTTTHAMVTASYFANFNYIGGGVVQIFPQAGALLGKGTYSDTVTVTVCLDSACVNPVGSPLTIAVQYTVTDTETVTGPNGYTFQILQLHTADIAWDAVHARLYLSTPPDASNTLGAIRTLDPSTLSLGTPVSVGHTPTALAISDDGQFMYVGLADSSSVLRLLLPSLATDLAISLSPYQSLPQFAFDIAVAPGQPHSISLATSQASGSIGGTNPLLIFDDGIARPNVGPVVSHMQWSADATSLYAMGLSTNAKNLYTLAIGAAGVNATTAVTGYVQDARVHADQGLVYIDGGFIVDPTNGTLAQQLQNVYQVLPDSAHGKIFAYAFSSSTDGFAIQSFDINTFAPIASVPVPLYVDNGVRLIRWGTSGLALTTDFGYVILVSGAFVGP